MSTIKETVFSHAVALTQAGRLKNTIYCGGSEIFIFNQDKTVLLNFTLPSREPGIKGEVAFVANDYDSSRFKEENGQIIFTSSEGEYVRTKTCKAPEKKFSDIQGLYEAYLKKDSHYVDARFEKSVVSLMDESLSHIEMSVQGGIPKIVQRDIYTGSTIEITPRPSALGLSFAAGDENISPVGIRTNDFVALFTFCNFITFSLSKAEKFAFITGDRFEMQGVISLCEYDELGELSESM